MGTISDGMYLICSSPVLKNSFWIFVLHSIISMLIHFRSKYGPFFLYYILFKKLITSYFTDYKVGQTHFYINLFLSAIGQKWIKKICICIQYVHVNISTINL